MMLGHRQTAGTEREGSGVCTVSYLPALRPIGEPGRRAPFGVCCRRSVIKTTDRLLLGGLSSWAMADDRGTDFKPEVDLGESRPRSTSTMEAQSTEAGMVAIAGRRRRGSRAPRPWRCAGCGGRRFTLATSGVGAGRGPAAGCGEK